MKTLKTVPSLVAELAPASKTSHVLVQTSTVQFDLERWETDWGVGDDGVGKSTVFSDFGGNSMTPLDDW